MKNPKRFGGKKVTVVNLILAIALIGSVTFVIYSSNKNKLKTLTESSKEKSVSENSIGIDTNIPVAKTSETEEAKKIEMIGKDKEETTFDQPVDVVWEGEIIATFASGQDYGIKKIPEDKDFPYFYAGINSDAFPEHVVLDGKVEVTGKWTGITCAYQNTVFKRCVPEVEVQKIARTEPPEDWSKPYAFSIGDFSGDKIPDVLEETYTGGAHCCYDYKAYIKVGNGTLEMTFDKSDPNQGVVIKDVNNDGVFELVGADSAGFNYWKASFADSPAPEIIASYNNDSRDFFLNLSLMKKPAPSQEEINKKLEEANQNYDKERNSDSEGLSPLVWRYMLDLIYSGNEKTAWEFFDQAWPKDVPGKEKFKAEFQQVLETSPYYEEIKKLNANESENGKEKFKIITVKNGPNEIDLNSDGIQDLVVKSFRNNGESPHNWSVYNFFMNSQTRVNQEKNDEMKLKLIQIAEPAQEENSNSNSSDAKEEDLKALESYMGSQNNGSFTFSDKISTHQGADGVLRDIRIVKESSGKVFLVVASRDLNESYASEEPVNFLFYSLFNNRKWDKDGPDYFFEYLGAIKAKNNYVDVNEAMNKELLNVLNQKF